MHLHCNHHAILRRDDEIDVLKRIGLDLQVLDSGCCGMGGSFGFEKEHFEVSMQCAERVLLPAVRAAQDDELIITDGYSCREQIAQSTNRQTQHLAEVLRLAIREGAAPEQRRAAAKVDA